MPLVPPPRQGTPIPKVAYLPRPAQGGLRKLIPASELGELGVSDEEDTSQEPGVHDDLKSFRDAELPQPQSNTGATAAASEHCPATGATSQQRMAIGPHGEHREVEAKGVLQAPPGTRQPHISLRESGSRWLERRLDEMGLGPDSNPSPTTGAQETTSERKHPPLVSSSSGVELRQSQHLVQPSWRQPPHPQGTSSSSSSSSTASSHSSKVTHAKSETETAAPGPDATSLAERALQQHTTTTGTKQA
jgi:hypothetical protein